MLTIVLLISLVVVLSGVIAFVLIWKVLAPSDKFFGFLEEGTAVILLKNKAFWKVLIQYKGRTLNGLGNVVDGSEGHFLGGLRWFGIYPFVTRYERKMRWMSIHADGTVQPHDDLLKSVMLKNFPYLLTINGAEDRDMLKLDIRIIAVTRVTNPRKAMFEVQDWLEMLLAMLEPTFRTDIISLHSFEELKSISQSEIDAVLGDFASRFEAAYGVLVESITIRDVTPPIEVQDSAKKKWEAIRDKDSIAIRADAENIRLTRIAEALAAHPEAVQALALEALGRSPATAVIPGIAKILRDIFPD